MEKMVEHGSSLTPLFIFFIVTIIQFVPRYLDNKIKKGMISEIEKQLRAEIKQLLKEASALSQPSTFAQAAKFRRTAAVKEKELAKYQEQHNMEKKSSYDPFMKFLTPVKMLTYLLLTVWFWGSPVAIISKELVQPIGNVLSWKAAAIAEGKVMVGILPWLIVSTRVSKLICRKAIQ